MPAFAFVVLVLVAIAGALGLLLPIAALLVLTLVGGVLAGLAVRVGCNEHGAEVFAFLGVIALAVIGLMWVVAVVAQLALMLH